MNAVRGSVMTGSQVVEASQLSVNAFDAARDASERTRIRELARKQRLGEFRRTTLARIKQKAPAKQQQEDAWGSLLSDEESASQEDEESIQPIPRPETPLPMTRTTPSDLVDSATAMDLLSPHQSEDKNHQGSQIDNNDNFALSLADEKTTSPRKEKAGRSVFVASDDMFLHHISVHDVDNEANRKAARRRLLAVVSSTSHNR